MKRLALAFLLTLFATTVRAADPQPRQDSMGRDYYLYTPDRIDKQKTYWLVVGVHGYGGNGKGAAGIAPWAKHGDCIVVGPSFPNNGYQGLGQQAGEQLDQLFKDLGKEYKLHPKLFLYGFSGGAQFAHRFMMAYPDLVAGCSAHSAGSWSTGEHWGNINPKAANIPLVISCGQSDTAKSTPDAPYTRLEWAKLFEKKAAEAGLLFQAAYWPNTAHAATPGVVRMTTDCYDLATKIQPPRQAAIDAIKKSIEEKKIPQAKRQLEQARRLGGKGTTPLTQKAAARFIAELDTLKEQLK
jgi:predicted esterase